MAKQLLPHDVTPEDRKLGCFWASTFRRPGDEQQKFGDIGGAPIIDHGFVGDGAGDLITYDLWGQFARRDPVSYHVIFYPDFNYDEDVSREIFDTSGNDYRILKRDLAGAYNLRIDIGNTTIVNLTTAIYGALWRQGARNVFTVSSTSGATDAWLNGTQVLTAWATAWTPVDVTTLSVAGSAGTFDGRIESLKFYNALLTEEDHQAVWEGGGA